jgi:hypothetical protein
MPSARASVRADDGGSCVAGVRACLDPWAGDARAASSVRENSSKARENVDSEGSFLDTGKLQIRRNERSTVSRSRNALVSASPGTELVKKASAAARLCGRRPVPAYLPEQNSSTRAHSGVWTTRSRFGVKRQPSCRSAGINSYWTTCQRCIKSSWRVVFMGGRYDHRIQYPDHAGNGRPHPLFLPLSPVQNPILPGFAKGSRMLFGRQTMKYLLAAVSVFFSCVCHSQDSKDYVFVETGRNDGPLYILEDNTVFFGDCRLLHLNTMSLSKSCDLINHLAAVAASPRRDMLLLASLSEKKQTSVSYLYNVRKRKILHKKYAGYYEAKYDGNDSVALHPNGRLLAKVILPHKLDFDLRLVDLDTKPLSKPISMFGEPKKLFFSDDGTKLHVQTKMTYMIFCVDASRNTIKKCSLDWNHLNAPIISNKSPNKAFAIECDSNLWCDGSDRGGDYIVIHDEGVDEFRAEMRNIKLDVLTTDEIAQANEEAYDFSRDGKTLVMRGHITGEDGMTKSGLAIVRLPKRASRLTPPAFDCARAATKVEITICADDNISLLDATLDRNYKQINAAFIPAGDQTRATQLRDNQRAWLKERNA